MSQEKQKRKRGLNRPLELRIAEMERKAQELRNKAMGISVKPDLSQDPEMAEIEAQLTVAQNSLAKLVRWEKDGEDNAANLEKRAASWRVKQKEAANQIPAAQDLLDQIRAQRDAILAQRIAQAAQNQQVAQA